MKLPQFKLWELSLATLLIATGFGCLQYYVFGADAQVSISVFRIVALPFGIPLITAGAMLPFGRARLGAYAGFFGQIIFAWIATVAFGGWKYARRLLLEDLGTQITVGLTAFVLVLTVFAIASRLWRSLLKHPMRND